MGLLDTKTPQGNDAPLAQTEGAPQPGQQPDAGESDTESNVSAEEQKQYDEFVGAGMDLIYSGKKAKVMPEILESLRGANAPAMPEEGAEEGMPPPDAAGDAAAQGNPAIIALANTAVQVIQRVDTAGHEADNPVPDETLYHAATEIIEQLAEIAEAAGIHTYEEDELNGALFQAVDMYRPIAIELGRTSEETLKGQFGEIVDADKAGRLGDVLPGMGRSTVGEAPVVASE